MVYKPTPYKKCSFDFKNMHKCKYYLPAEEKCLNPRAKNPVTVNVCLYCEVLEEAHLVWRPNGKHTHKKTRDKKQCMWKTALAAEERMKRGKQNEQS